MKYELTYSGGVAELRCTKEFVFENGMAALNEVLEAPWRPEMRCLLILDEGSAFSPTRDDIKTIKGVMDRILSDQQVRIAIVVSKIVHYGIGRVIEARVDHGSGRVRVFLREEAARQWLSIPSGAAGGWPGRERGARRSPAARGDSGAGGPGVRGPPERRPRGKPNAHQGSVGEQGSVGDRHVSSDLVQRPRSPGDGHRASRELLPV